MSNFHKTKKSAAVQKHAIIDQYATPFASKTGSTSLDHRVAFIDGYAGPGRCEDGEEGSGAMLVRKAKELAHFPRQVECHFVEEDPKTAAQLREVAAAEGADAIYTIHEGDISAHLPELLESAKGIPLFTYLDPFGLIIPLDDVATIFGRPSGYGTPATEGQAGPGKEALESWKLILLTHGLRDYMTSCVFPPRLMLPSSDLLREFMAGLHFVGVGEGGL